MSAITVPHHARAFRTLVLVCATTMLSVPASADSFIIDFGEAYPVNMASMDGEWTGVFPDFGAILALRVSRSRNKIWIAITQEGQSGGHATVFESSGLVSQKGRLTVGGPRDPMWLEAKVWPVMGLGYGEGKFTFVSNSGEWSSDVYLFRRREGSWLQWMVELYARAGAT